MTHAGTEARADDRTMYSELSFRKENTVCLFTYIKRFSVVNSRMSGTWSKQINTQEVDHCD